jgi:hypothetical protein
VMINPLEYHRACGGGVDDRVERWGRTGGSSNVLEVWWTS